MAQSGIIKSQSETARRIAERSNQSVRHNETESTAELRERQLEEQRRLDAMKNKKEFWQIVSGGTLVIGMLLGWMI